MNDSFGGDNAMKDEPLNVNITTNQAVLDAEALLALFDTKSHDYFGEQFAGANRDVLGALVLFADQAITLAAKYAESTPRDVRLMLREAISGAVAISPRPQTKGGSK